MKQINSTTFQAPELGDVKPTVIIGGSPVDKFIPNINISFYNDEFFINLNRKDKQAKTGIAQTAELDGYDKDIFYIDENGRFKWDIEFKERPLKNSWTWELKHAEGIEFCYQGELTPEEISDGCERPLEVVGSYAVYCNKANNKYKTGKLCHIYRPFCYDINGDSIYADLKIADGKLTITIDEKWLDNAAYPVRLDPTIGYTTVCATEDGYYSTYHFYTNVTSGSNAGTATAIKIACYDSTATYKIKMGLFSNSSERPGTLITNGYTGEISIARTTKPTQLSEWTSGVISSNISANTTYHLGFVPNANSVRVYYDSGSGCNYEGSTTYAAFPKTPEANALSRIYSIYLEYTESGGSSLPAIINNYRQQGAM